MTEHLNVKGPQRIQRKRTKGWQMPTGAIYVGRPSKWGNPYPVGAVCSPKALPFFESTVVDSAHSVELFRRWMTRDPHVPLSGFNRHRVPPSVLNVVAELSGKDLVCWCKPGEPCHADVLLEIANNEVPR